MTTADERNARTLADMIVKLREELAEERAARDVLARQVAIQGNQIRTLQELFATRTVARTSGPTSVS